MLLAEHALEEKELKGKSVQCPECPECPVPQRRRALDTRAEKRIGGAEMGMDGMDGMLP